MPASDEPTSLNTLLKRDVILEAPVYQRRFSWAESQLTDFWDDFDAVKGHDEDTLFLGAIILRHEASSRSSWAERWLIIDGQQRLTALSLAIAAICLEAPVDDPETGTFVADTVHRYLLPTSSGNLRERETKIMVTTPDLDDYRAAIALIDTESVRPLRSKVVESSKIQRALEFHREQIRLRLPTAPRLADFVALLDELVEKVELVEIHLADRHDPNQVFNRLNTKGQVLTLGDLVRNEAFGRFSADR